MSEKKLIELHLHLDGSLRPETVWELSKEQGIAIPASSPEDVKFKMEVPEDCKTLEEYLERFALPLMVLQRADAIERVTFELVEDLAKEGVTYAEIRFAPQLSVSGGLPGPGGGGGHPRRRAGNEGISSDPCGADPLLYERGYEPGAQHADCGDGEKIPGQRGLRRGYRRG